VGKNLNNVKIKKVPIILDKERHLVYDLNAYAELEDYFGSVEKALEELEKGKMKTLRAVLWAGLVHEDEALTIKDVGGLIDANNLQEVVEAIGNSLSVSLPDEESKEGKN
jgi:hypothetical protein